MSLVITQESPSPISYTFSSLEVAKDSNGIRAYLYFLRKDENGEDMGTKSFVITGTDFNTFWANFNSGTYLYQYLATALSSTPPANDSLEADFTNDE